MEGYYILTFNNTLGAINGEATLKQNGIKIEIMPTPTSITKSCGISIKVEIDMIDQVKKLIKEGKINIKNAYLKNNNEYKIVEI